MKITRALMKFVDKGGPSGVWAGADAETYWWSYWHRIKGRIETGELTQETFDKLMEDPDVVVPDSSIYYMTDDNPVGDPSRDVFTQPRKKKQMSPTKQDLAAAIRVVPRMMAWLNDNGHRPTTRTIEQYQIKCAKALLAGDLNEETFISFYDEEDDMSSTVTPKQLFSNGGGSASNPNVKSPSSMYSDKAVPGRHVKTNQPIFDERGREVCLPSELNYAKAGAIFKRLMFRAGVQEARLSEHEQALFDQTCAEDTWIGTVGKEEVVLKDHAGGHVKALLDDALSGGQQLVPEWMDTDVVSTPQLSGELWPYVTKKEVPQGRLVEGASIGQIQFTSGEGVDDGEMALFNTAGLIAALNTTIYPAGAAIEFGKDHASDAAVEVGRLITTEISNSAMAWLDEQVAIGDGLIEPQGVMAAAGTTAVAFAGAHSIANVENLLFSVPKAQRPMNTPVVRFCGTEQSYARIRALQVALLDFRRLFGMTHEDFVLLNRPFSVSTAMTNRQLFFGDLSKYRAYRRKGLALETHTQGSYLARRNLVLITARMRTGGRVVLPSSFGVVADAPV